MERSTIFHHFSSWVNPLFRLGHGFNSKLLQKLPEGMDFSQNFYGLRAMNSEFFEGDSCRLNFGVSVVLSVSTLWSPAIFFFWTKKNRCSKVVLDLALAQNISKSIETQNIGRATPLVIKHSWKLPQT